MVEADGGEEAVLLLVVVFSPKRAADAGRTMEAVAMEMRAAAPRIRWDQLVWELLLVSGKQLCTSSSGRVARQVTTRWGVVGG